MDLAETQRSIETLPKDQRLALVAWFATQDQAEWDAEIERDLSPGGADMGLIEEMKADASAGKFRPLSKAGHSSGSLPRQMAFQSFASWRFWQLYNELPVEGQRSADKQSELCRWAGSVRARRKKQRGVR